MASADARLQRLLPIALLVSLGLHILALTLLETHPVRRTPAKIVDLLLVEPPKPPAPLPPPPPKVEPVKPLPPPERSSRLIRPPLSPPPPTPNTLQPPPEQPAAPVEPVTGVTQASVVSEPGPAIAVPVGNTMMGTPAPKPPPAESVAMLVPVDLASLSREPRLLSKPTPQEVFGADYPPDARAQNIQGLTRVKLLIDESGTVKKVQAVKGPPLLRAAAEALALRFRYVPAQKDGKPVAVWWIEEIPFRIMD